MKNILFVLLLAFPSFVNAQFTLTPAGFVSTVDSTKNFLVVDAPGLKQADLYKKAMVYLNASFVSPKNVLSVVDGESITINGLAKDAIKMKVLYLNPTWDIDYTITLQFKDGKFRLSEPHINKISTYTGDVYRVATIGPGPGKEIYNKKGELKQKDGKENLEVYFNAFIKTMITGITTGKQENW